MIVDKQHNRFNSVTCAYDRSESSSQSLKLSAYIAGTLSLPLEVVNVNDDEQERIAILDEAKNYLQPYDLSASYRHETGDPEELLIQVTKDAPEPTVLTMGSYGHSRIREAILGSTTVQVMRRAAKPIILTK
jgi:nucleotide-binding universal stress UspA family protein